MSVYYKIVRNGVDEYHELTEGASMPAGAVVVPRLPNDSEEFVGGAFVRDDEMYADRQVPHDHIDTVHVIKSVEASLILSGYNLTHGLLVEESEATEIPLNTLANLVYNYYTEMIDKEKARRALKVAARQAANDP
jgi:hypothetical protein